MLVVTCPKCEKQLNLPENSRNKHVRCMGCQYIVLASTEPPRPKTPPPRRPAGPPPVPVARHYEQEEEPVDELNPVPEALPGLRCASCQAVAVVELPPDANSRKPGYVCAMCRTVMRPAGSRGKYYAATLLGAMIGVLGLGLVYLAFQLEPGRKLMIGGGLAIAALGVGVAGWGVYQARLPVPIGAEAASRSG